MNQPDSVGSTRSSLLAAVRVRDADAWRRMADLYGPLVFHWLRRHGLGQQDAADVFQEVFLSVAKSIDRYDHTRPDSTFRGWLWTIARNQTLSLRRRRRGQAEAAGGSDAAGRLAQIPEQLPDEASDAAACSLTTALVHRGAEAVRAEFEDRTWQAFWRVTVQGQSTAEVAADLGVTPGAVRQSRSRVLRRLRQELGDLLD